MLYVVQNTHLRVRGRLHKPGDTLELSEELAAGLVARKRLSPVDTSAAPKVLTALRGKKGSTSGPRSVPKAGGGSTRKKPELAPKVEVNAEVKSGDDVPPELAQVDAGAPVSDAEPDPNPDPPKAS